MEILFITWNFPPRRGGMEQLLGSLCEELSKSHKLFIITAYADHSCSPRTGIIRPSRPGLVPFFCYALWQGALLLRCHRDIRVVFGGSVLVAPLVCILSRIFRRKALIQAHGLDLLYPSFIYQMLIVRWLRFCDHCEQSLYGSSGERQRRIRGIDYHHSSRRALAKIRPRTLC
jgi:phosphatidylinositol alpha-1,6-mannosyltransferase